MDNHSSLNDLPWVPLVQDPPIADFRDTEISDGSGLKVKVTLYAGGQTFEEVVVVAKFEDAKRTAQARNPSAKVIAMNPVY